MDKELKKKAINIHGKEYVLVKDRVIYFNENYPDGKIETTVKDTGRGVLAMAKVTPNAKEGERYYTGHAESLIEAKGVESENMVEVAETSAVGRALAMMGIGVIDSIASVDEMKKAGAYGKKKSYKSKKSYKPKEVAGKCEECGAGVSEKVKSYSKSKYNKVLCYNCQKNN